MFFTTHSIFCGSRFVPNSAIINDLLMSKKIKVFKKVLYFSFDNIYLIVLRHE